MGGGFRRFRWPELAIPGVGLALMWAVDCLPPTVGWREDAIRCALSWSTEEIL